MCLEPRREAGAALRRAEPLEHAKHLGHLARVVAGAAHIAQAELVGLTLIVAGKLEVEDPERPARRAGVLRDLGACHAAGGETETDQLLLTHLGGRVPGGDVADLVAHDGGELGLVGEMGEESPRHVDEAAGNRERVHCRIVHDPECPGKAGSL